MNNLSFQNFYQLKEMAYGTFKMRGKEAGHINSLNMAQVNWILERILDPKGGPVPGKPGQYYPPARLSMKFMADDGSGRLSFDQVVDALKIRQQGLEVAPTSVGKPVEAAKGPDSNPSVPTSMKNKTTDPPENKKDETDEDRAKKQIPAEKISEYQKSIDEAFSKSNQHLIINALAGTGKTTILKHLAAKYGKGQRWLYLVFNKVNQIDAESDFPSGVVPKTSHSFMIDVIKRTLSENPGALPGYSSFKIDPRKVNKILDQDKPGQWFFNAVRDVESSLSNDKQGYLIRYNNKARQETVAYGVKTRVGILVGLAKNEAVDPRKSDAIEKIKKIFEKHQDEKRLTPYVFSGNNPGPDFSKEWFKLTLEVLKATMPGGSTGNKEIDLMKDFDDMLWHPATHPERLSWPGSSTYQVALVDEVQDFNQAQKIMLENLAKNGIRIVAVGDPNQAIYGFRGADSKSFSNIESLLSSTSRGASSHSLPVNYRSGKKIIDFVNQVTHVKSLSAGRDHIGEVNEDVPQKNLVDQVDQEWKDNNSLNQETAFISRNNAPLFEIAVGLLQKGIPFKILGSDFSEEIIDYIYKAIGDGVAPKGKINARSTSLQDFLHLSENYLVKEQNKYEDKKEKEKYLQELSKLHEALVGYVSHIMMDQSDKKHAMSNVAELCDKIKSTFKGLDPSESEQDRKEYKNIDKKKNVILTTAHKSKGLEFERVNIISNELFPATGEKSDSDDQEQNAKYVAYTRATHTLNISHSPKDEQ